MMHVLFCGVLRLNKPYFEIHLCYVLPRLFYIKLGGLEFLVFWMLKIIMMDLSFVAFYVMVSFGILLSVSVSFNWPFGICFKFDTFV